MSTEIDARRVSATIPPKNLVGFVVGDVHYAVDDRARARDREPARRSSRCRTRPREVAGVADYRGEVVPVIDLRVRFGLPVARTPTRRDEVDRASTSPATRSSALVVDAVTEVFGAGGDELRPAPPLGGGDDVRGIAGVTTHGGRLVFVLDIVRLRDARRAARRAGRSARRAGRSPAAGAHVSERAPTPSAGSRSRPSPRCAASPTQQIAEAAGAEARELLAARARRRRLARAQGGGARRRRASSRATEVVAALVAALGERDNIGLRNAAVEVLVAIGPDAVPGARRRARAARRRRAQARGRGARRRRRRARACGALARRSPTTTPTCASPRPRRSARARSPARRRATIATRALVASARDARRRSSRSPRSRRSRASRRACRGRVFEPLLARSAAPAVAIAAARRVARAATPCARSPTRAATRRPTHRARGDASRSGELVAAGAEDDALLDVARDDARASRRRAAPRPRAPRRRRGRARARARRAARARPRARSGDVPRARRRARRRRRRRARRGGAPPLRPGGGRAAPRVGERREPHVAARRAISLLAASLEGADVSRGARRAARRRSTDASVDVVAGAVEALGAARAAPTTSRASPPS